MMLRFYAKQSKEEGTSSAGKAISPMVIIFSCYNIINWISIYGIDGIDDRELIAIAKEKMNVIDTLELRINGLYLTSELMKNRVLSTFFDIDLPENNIFGLDEGRRRCISDGFWIFFQSNSDRLIVSSNSSCSSGITKIGVEYHLSKV